MQKYLCFLASILIVISACAHKAPPLFKDRMKPKLVRIRALNNRQVQLSFSEDLDTLSLNEKSITIYGGLDTLDIVTLYPSFNAAEITCLTKEQKMIKYQVTGSVYDTAQNKGIIAASFEGSAVPDTVAPYIAKYSQGAHTSDFTLWFSEAMDTARTAYHVLPRHATCLEWQGLRTCRITPTDTNDFFGYNTTYYLFINQGMYDASGNMLQPFITSITPDTAYKPLALECEVHANDTLVHEGIAVLARNELQGITFIRSGRIKFEVRDSQAYTIQALSNGYYGTAVVWTDSINILPVSPSEITIDSIIR